MLCYIQAHPLSGGELGEFNNAHCALESSQLRLENNSMLRFNQVCQSVQRHHIKQSCFVTQLF